ncbi:mitochondrial ribosomal protein S7 [Oratosquilla oratoria]|uniref:mitochondrial ribosomal protein S7 n=1 Tax=Oratosquilla oratoria TaxID=337810 RepID=UPI003F777561
MEGVRRGMGLLKVLQQFSRSPCSFNETQRVSILQLKKYSIYPPHHKEPIVNKDTLEELKKAGSLQELQFTPIKPALADQTTSVFHDVRVRKFTNYIMKCGQKALARELLERTFENIKRIQVQQKNRLSPEERNTVECDPVKLFHTAVENCRPVLQLSGIKRGGMTYQVPMPITEKRSYFVAMRWLVEAGRDKERKVHLPEKLAREILDAARNEGRVVKKKQDLHRQCEANRAYAHYRWG